MNLDGVRGIFQILLPFELFLPIPSLSTTSSVHLICRPGVASSTWSVAVPSFSALNLSVPEIRTEEWFSCETAGDSN
jgi:hypothetical protein